MAAFAAIYALSVWCERHEQGTVPGGSSRTSAFGASWQQPLATMGRSSLFIYWIHVELVYGYASWLWRHRLPLWGTAIAYVLFCVLMYRAIGWRDRLVGAWRQGSRPQFVSAPSG
jgi:hypothetical protein